MTNNIVQKNVRDGKGKASFGHALFKSQKSTHSDLAILLDYHYVGEPIRVLDLMNELCLL